ncbi:hypothetical protein B0H19DRAFT_1075902 [Mycena capillaripes]|nr:hypothetical protein B0H19DRAFT_1075902 [Mycena capillaripes]
MSGVAGKYQMIKEEYLDLAEQHDFLHARLPTYLAAKAESKETSMTRFWNSLDAAWFQTFSEEAKLGLLPRVPGAVPLTEEERQMVGDATTKTKKSRARAWGRRRGARVGGGGGGRSLFQLLQRQKSKRPLRPVEVYQKSYKPKIMEEVLKLGYGEMNEEAEAGGAAAAKGEAGPVTVLTHQENKTCLADLASDQPSAPYRQNRIWRHNDTPIARNSSGATSTGYNSAISPFQCMQKYKWYLS